MKTIADFTDKELADMVRNCVYTAGTTFSEEHARFLLVLAIPYGPEDTVESLPEAIEAFQLLLSDDDWIERRFQVYDHKTGEYFCAAREDFESET